MGTRKWKYQNLSAEMARNGISVEQVAASIGISRITLYSRFRANHKNVFSLDEAYQIRDALFPTLTIDYLFATSEHPEVKGNG